MAYGVVDIDGETAEGYSGDDIESVAITFDYDATDCGREDCRQEGEHVSECDYAGERFPSGAEAFVNGAGVRIQDNEVSVWISTGDPRGAFQMSVRRLDDGRLVLHVPYQGMGFAHEDLYELHPGAFQVRTAPVSA